MKKITEATIQDQIWFQYGGKGHLMMIPRSEALGWEADMLIVTRALFTHEFEIKISRGDFLKDKKKEKIDNMRRFRSGEVSWLQVTKSGLTWTRQVLTPANYFWYACPTNLIAIKEVPEWAGLMYVDLHTFKVVKRAPRLHAQKLEQKVMLQICRSMMFKYWNARLDNHNQQEVAND